MSGGINSLILPKDTEQKFCVYIGSVCIGSIYVSNDYNARYGNPEGDLEIKEATVEHKHSVHIFFYGPDGMTTPKPHQDPKNLIEAMNYFLGQLPDAVKPFVVFTESK